MFLCLLSYFCFQQYTKWRVPVFQTHLLECLDPWQTLRVITWGQRWAQLPGPVLSNVHVATNPPHSPTMWPYFPLSLKQASGVHRSWGTHPGSHHCVHLKASPTVASWWTSWEAGTLGRRLLGPPGKKMLWNAGSCCTLSSYRCYQTEKSLNLPASYCITLHKCANEWKLNGYSLNCS